MNLWIVTIGSSDIQLDSKKTCKDKGRKDSQLSHKVWDYWCSDEIKEDYGLPFPCDPKPAFSDVDEPYKVGARILGTVYKANTEKIQQEIWEYLTFPLLDDFVRALQKSPPKAIAVLLTDQSRLFADDNQRRKPKSPYWQDTCELNPILEKYFKDKFSGISCEWIYLDPKSEEQRLDNWDEVLKLVDSKFSNHFSKELPQGSIVYVSHQAGTPAISSAVQFSSLARFGDRVRFLVSSEQNTRHPEALPGSFYLEGIRKQEAKKLLERHDYSGVQDLINLDDEKHQETKILLEAAVQWNFARFDEFANELQKLSSQDLAQVVKERSQHWWWTAYEAAYLAWLRLDQGNTVDAFFHSFRSIEGAFSNWGKQVFHKYIEIENDRAFLQPSILESSNEYFKSAKFKQDGTPKNSLAKLKQKLSTLAEKIKDIREKDQKPKGLLLFGEDLYIFFRSQKPDYEESNLKRFWNSEDGIGEKRNKNFHQLQGLSKEDLLSDWEVNDLKEWEEKLLIYLNFIVKEDFPEGFKTLEEASLMAKVHEELKRAIDVL